MSHSAMAALGEPEASVEADTALLHARVTATDRAAYRLHEIQLPSGTLVREYSGPGGTVFAVTWKGPYAPDLRQLLGRYFDEYAAAARAARGDHHHLSLRQSDLIVEVNVHMRAYAGRAYLPAQIPPGMSIGELL